MISTLRNFFYNIFRTKTIQDELVLQLEQQTRAVIQSELAEIRAEHEVLYKKDVLNYLIHQAQQQSKRVI